jgi:HEAT repeat protein
LGEIGGQEARALLVGMAKDKNLYVRKAAQEALEKVSDLKFS